MEGKPQGPGREFYMKVEEQKEIRHWREAQLTLDQAVATDSDELPENSEGPENADIKDAG